MLLLYSRFTVAWLGLLTLSLNTAADTDNAALSMDKAIELALQANHQYLNLLDQRELSELDYESARSVYKTKFGSSASSDARSGAEVGKTYSIFMNKKNESGSGYSAGFYSSSFGNDSLSELRFSYTLPIFTNPLDDNRLAVDRMEINAERTRRMLEIGREELINQVISSYLRLALAMKKQDLAGQKLAIAQEYMLAQKIRYENGEVSLLDLAESELTLVDGKQERQQALYDRLDREDNFRLQLGLEAGAPLLIDVDILTKTQSHVADKSLSDLEQHANTHRTEILGKREEILMVSKKIEATRSGRIPPVEISLQYALVGDGDSIEDSFDFNDQRVGLGFRMNTDLANSEAKIKRRKLFLMRRAQQREYDHLQRSVGMEVRKAYMDRKRSESQLEYLNEYLELVNKKHQHAEILHSRGDITQMELLESHHRTTEAQLRALSARVDFLLAEHQLAIASGLQRY